MQVSTATTFERLAEFQSGGKGGDVTLEGLGGGGSVTGGGGHAGVAGTFLYRAIQELLYTDYNASVLSEAEV